MFTLIRELKEYSISRGTVKPYSEEEQLKFNSNYDDHILPLQEKKLDEKNTKEVCEKLKDQYSISSKKIYHEVHEWFMQWIDAYCFIVSDQERL